MVYSHRVTLSSLSLVLVYSGRTPKEKYRCRTLLYDAVFLQLMMRNLPFHPLLANAPAILTMIKCKTKIHVQVGFNLL